MIVETHSLTQCKHSIRVFNNDNTQIRDTTQEENQKNMVDPGGVTIYTHIYI